MRLVYLVSHPIQYQAPLLRRIAAEPDIELTVLFGSDFSARAYRDEGFGATVAWDTPLLQGYKSEVLPALFPFGDNDRVSATRPLSRGIYDRLKSLKPDALWVHGYASLNSLHGIMAANALGIPVLLRAESWLSDRRRSRVKLAVKRLFFNALSGKVAAVLPIGTQNAAYWQHYLPSTPQFLMPYAVDNERFAAEAETARPGLATLRQELGIAEGRPVVLFASKLQTRKRAADLLRAFSIAAQRLKNARMPCLLIVGDGEEFSYLKQLATELPIPGDSVSFAGFRNQSELPGLFALADVFVLPSEHEPWGLVVNEAMAAGCPAIVSSDVGCHTDLITDSVEGFVYPVGDTAVLADALYRAWATQGLCKQMGMAAQQRIGQWSFAEDIAGLRYALASTTKIGVKKA